MNASLTLTDNEAHEASGIAYVMEHCDQQRLQIAAELAYLRSVFEAARRDRRRLPIATQRQVNRYPTGARLVTFTTARPRLELTP
jgi:hypothetical protein